MTHTMPDNKQSIKKRGFEKISHEQWSSDVFNSMAYGFENIKLPKRATSHAAGYDIYSPIDFTLEPNEEIKMPTGIKAFMLADEWLMILPRSGLGFKFYTRLANTVGVGDSDFYNNPKTEGHYWVKIRNEGNTRLEIKAGDGVAQCIFQKYLLIDEDDYVGEKRIGGLGSTSEPTIKETESKILKELGY